jgi:hypothetical protein
MRDGPFEKDEKSKTGVLTPEQPTVGRGHRGDRTGSGSDPPSRRPKLHRWRPGPGNLPPWIPLVLASLVALCLVLAAWVWFEILRLGP